MVCQTLIHYVSHNAVDTLEERRGRTLTDAQDALCFLGTITVSPIPHFMLIIINEMIIIQNTLCSTGSVQRTILVVSIQGINNEPVV